MVGDIIAAALERLGVTEDRVAIWLRTDKCGCSERKEKLNQLTFWAKQFLTDNKDKARKVLDDLLDS